MGHAHHFLSCLDSIFLPHVEIALDLYNVSLGKFILESAHISEGAAENEAEVQSEAVEA